MTTISRTRFSHPIQTPSYSKSRNADLFKDSGGDMNNWKTEFMNDWKTEMNTTTEPHIQVVILDLSTVHNSYVYDTRSNVLQPKLFRHHHLKLSDQPLPSNNRLKFQSSDQPKLLLPDIEWLRTLVLWIYLWTKREWIIQSSCHQIWDELWCFRSDELWGDHKKTPSLAGPSVSLSTSGYLNWSGAAGTIQTMWQLDMQELACSWA